MVAFFMAHEVSNTQAFLKELHTLLKPDGRFFMVEPKIHVSRRDFEIAVQEALSIRFEVFERPSVRLGRAVLFNKGPTAGRILV